MPKTIAQGFETFLGRLTPSDTESNAAKSHRKSIEQCLKSGFEITRFWRIGSFGNGTSISGHSDVDYMAVIPGRNLSSSSSASLTKVSNALATRFPRTGVRTNCPAVVVPFGTDPSETTEVTPAYIAASQGNYGVYGIPDCSGRWMSSSPDAHNGYVRTQDSRLSNRVKPLIRFLKAWKYYRDVPISSFYLELRVAKYAETESTIVYSIDVKRVLQALSNIDLAAIRDPMGISGNIPACRSAHDLSAAKSRLATALQRAQKAREAEDADRIEEAFNWWRKLFNFRFPSYG